MSALSDYLAKNYSSKEKTIKKAKKKKEKKPEITTIIDDGGLNLDNDVELEDIDTNLLGEDAPVIVGKSNSKFKPQKGFKTREGKIILKLESELQDIDTTSTSISAPKGIVAGLQSAKEADELLKQKQNEELRRLIQQDPELSGRNAETVYRDSGGRVIDVHERKKQMEDEKKRKQQEKESRTLELNRSEMAQAEAESLEKSLNQVNQQPFARYVDDENLNTQLKSRQTYDDPLLVFSDLKEEETKRSATGRGLYQGSFSSNRFNIAPGVKWDGIDRSNGFEELVINKKKEQLNRKVQEDHYQTSEYDDFY